MNYYINYNKKTYLKTQDIVTNFVENDYIQVDETEFNRYRKEIQEQWDEEHPIEE